MKNQYVGDVNDFLKYALLRAIQSERSGKPLFVAWMLTPDDSGPDGMKLDYLEKSSTYRPIDIELFDKIRKIVTSGVRNVAAIESSRILDNATFFTETVPERDNRSGYGARMADACPDNSLAFFDPDNGMEIGKRSVKHLEWSELAEVARMASSFVIYQHNARPKGGLDAYFDHLMKRARASCPGTNVLTVRGPHAGFIVGLRDEDAGAMKALEGFVEVWPSLRLVFPEGDFGI